MDRGIELVAANIVELARRPGITAEHAELDVSLVLITYLQAVGVRGEILDRPRVHPFTVQPLEGAHE